ncbi:type VI secretion system protein VasL [Pseudomonas delhiensis]|uniref:Type VI secretion system protein VasL n=2 Tax=Pseudomonas delhiensis TaxID=366289 RepID=A0A239M269_9PSED|nr:type VI secretion system protein VasL [Pseudomonas delhiensis]SNT36745.1 type VI secretion system protein VasL [Pseudomonas delhiensis]
MSVLSEMQLRPGADPSKLAPYIALGGELAKLSHPACPDVNWQWVEYQCLELFQENGADLQSAAALALARSHVHGLPGMEQGLALVTALLSQSWPQLWPAALSARIQILTWLFAQLQPLVRRLELLGSDLPLLERIGSGLAGLGELLGRHAQVPLLSLEALQAQLASLARRLEREAAPAEAAPLSLPAALPAGAPAAPPRLAASPSVLVLKLDNPPPASQAQERRRGPRLLWLVLLLILLAGLSLGSFWVWHAARQDRDEQARGPDPVYLDSLLLFAPGSAELKPESTKVLIDGLMHIKAQPGWLIVVSGHSDNSGNERQNLALSQARAAAVRDWMQRMGDIPERCFVVQGLGASQPIASNDSEQGRSANRRVDVRLVPAPGACSGEAGAGTGR